jgi:exopolysaccharide biosynthesis operon protein EpsL
VTSQHERAAAVRAVCAAWIAAGVLTPAGDARALWDDRLELFISESVTRDDNVFRVSSGADRAPVPGTSAKGDTYQTTSLGFNFDVPVARQRFRGGLNWNDTHYERFSFLDLTGRNGRAEWLWQLGNELSGQMGYTETLALASLANIQNGVQSTTPNPLLIRRAFFNAAYLLTPRWQLQAEASRREQANGVPAFQVNDVSVDAGALAVRYISPAKNQIGLSVGAEEGRFPNQQLSPFDNAYRQQSVALVTEWTIAGHSYLRARAGRVSRSHVRIPRRDFEGAAYHAEYDWKPTGKLTLTAVAQRDISAVEEVNTSFVLVEGIALRPALRLTENLSLQGNFEQSDRDFLGDPLLGSTPARTERVRLAGLTLAYRPMRTLTLEIAMRRESRSSSVVAGDYTANVASVSARIGF